MEFSNISGRLQPQILAVKFHDLALIALGLRW